MVGMLTGGIVGKVVMSTSGSGMLLGQPPVSQGKDSMGIGSLAAAAGRQDTQEDSEADTWEPCRGGVGARVAEVGAVVFAMLQWLLVAGQCVALVCVCTKQHCCGCDRQLPPLRTPVHASRRYPTTRTTTTARRTMLCVCGGRIGGGMGWVNGRGCWCWQPRSRSGCGYGHVIMDSERPMVSDKTNPRRPTDSERSWPLLAWLKL